MSHDQKSHIAPDFDGLDLKNVMGPLIIPSTLCGTHPGANGHHMTKKVMWHLTSSCLEEYSGAIDDVFGITYL